jgi:chorismate dehydratase
MIRQGLVEPQATQVSPSSLRLPRFGQISFLNCLPISYPIEKKHVSLNADIIFANPQALNLAFAQNELDLGAMSSFYYLQTFNLKDNFQLLDGISISSVGAVGSVLFFTRVPLNKQSLKRVCVTAQSATSVNLLKVLLAEEYGLHPEFVASNQPDIFDPSFDGALIIGDRALEHDKLWSGSAERIDLSKWWYERYQLPMVFGLWAAKTSWVAANQEAVLQIKSQLLKALELGLSSLFPEVLTLAAQRSGLSKARLEQYYLSDLNFEMKDEHLAGLSKYKELCQKHNLIS